MPRHARIFQAGVPCHVTCRGNDGQDIVLCDGDRLRLLDELLTASRKNGLSIHAYVVMTNHIHLLVTGESALSLPTTIQDVGRRYVGYFNRRHDRTGTLWGGRYKSSLVADQRYLVNTHRYIEQNPLRAGIVPAVEAYPWSSYRYYGQGSSDSLITPHETWLALAESEEDRRAVHRELVDEALPEDVMRAIRLGSRSGYATGDPESCKALETSLGRRVTVAARGWRKGRRRSNKVV